MQNDADHSSQGFSDLKNKLKHKKAQKMMLAKSNAAVAIRDGDDEQENADDTQESLEVEDKSNVPFKLFDGTKQALSDLNEKAKSYTWLRRMKEIFLHMGDDANNREDNLFIEFDMELARKDLVAVCNRYIENERLILDEQEKEAAKKTTTTVSPPAGSLQHIQTCIEELNDLIKKSASDQLPSLLNKCIESLGKFGNDTQSIVEKLQWQRSTGSKLNARTILEIIRPLQITEKRKERSKLERKQEWDMKNLYVEVFKMSYRRNPLRTDEEKSELTPLKKGDDQPNFGNAIWWYSCDKANIYYQINSILRLENFELLMSYRYYLSDLCRMIEFMYQDTKAEKSKNVQKFYRAGNIMKPQLEKMKVQKGQVISLLGFISTTTDLKIAKGYARNQQVPNNHERVLFEINIKPEKPCVGFAYIRDISFHPEEEEVLFSMGSRFDVDQVLERQDGENFNIIQLTASEIDEKSLKQISTKVQDSSPSGRTVMLSRCLIELGEFRAARKYLNSLLTQSSSGGILSNDSNLAAIYCCLGETYARQGLYGDALKSYKQALNTQVRLEYSNNNALANIHLRIGLAYIGLGHFDEAKVTLERALNIQLRELNSNQQYLAAIYATIGYTYYKRGLYDEADKSFMTAQKIYEKPSNKSKHNELEQVLMKAEFLTNYGHLYSTKKDPPSAEKRYEEALKIYEEVLPEKDPKQMRSRINIMLIYAQNEKFDDVIKKFEDSKMKDLITTHQSNIFELNNSVTQKSLAFLHEFVGACYAMQRNYDKAMEMWISTLIFKYKARVENMLIETTNADWSSVTAEQNDLINKGYQRALKHYLKPNNVSNVAQNSKNDSLTDDFCLGFLYANSIDFEKSVPYLRKAMIHLVPSNDKSSAIVYLILADLFKFQRNYKQAIDYFNQALRHIRKVETEKDRVWEIQVELNRIDCFTKMNRDDIVIEELQRIEESFGRSNNGTTIISLRVILYDKLAQYYLKQKQYESFDDITNQSIRLKNSNFSQYHPSLATNAIMRAQYLTNQSPPQYAKALESYDKALEVQSLNMSSNHPSIRKIYYAIGDIYCQMNDLSSAMKNYKLAGDDDQGEDEDDFLPESDNTLEESMDILMAQISMHRYLAELHTKNKAYEEAKTEIKKVVDLLEAELPSSILPKTNERKMLKADLDTLTLVNRLKQLAECYSYLGDIMYSKLNMQSSEDINNIGEIGTYYSAALNIYIKLFAADETLVNSELVVILYKKLSNYYYETLEDKEDALKSLENLAKIQKPTLDILYLLWYLNSICGKQPEAEKIYNTILLHPDISREENLKQRVKKELDTIENNRKLRRSASTSSNQHDENLSEDSMSDLDDSNETSTNKTRGSRLTHQSRNSDSDINEDNEADSCDYRVKAAIYLKFEDFTNAKKYYEKDIEKRKYLIESNMFKMQLASIEENETNYENQGILLIWSKIFRFLAEKIKTMSQIRDPSTTALADSFFQFALLVDRTDYSYYDSIIAYVSAFALYASKSSTETKTLISSMQYAVDSFINHYDNSTEILTVGKRLCVPKHLLTSMYLKIAAMYRDCEIANIEDVDDDSNTINESRELAVAYYTELLDMTDDVAAQGACYYNILSLYNNYIYADDDDTLFVKNMIHYLPKLINVDRCLLASMTLEFLEENDDNTMQHNMEINRQLQAMAEYNSNQQATEKLESSIGFYLIQCDDFNGAKEYWDLVVERFEDDVPTRIVSLFTNSNTKYDQIIHTVTHLEEDTNLLLNQLITVCTKAGNFLMESAKNDQPNAAKILQDANNMFQKAADLAKQIESNRERNTRIDEKPGNVPLKI